MSASIYDSTGNGMATPQVVARRREYPFIQDGDNDTYLIYDSVIVLETEHKPLALDTPHPVYAEAILVEETPPANYETGWVQYDRVYATIGKGFTTYGSTVFRFPGITTSITSTAVTYTGATVTDPTSLNAARKRLFYVFDTGVSIGDALFVEQEFIANNDPYAAWTNSNFEDLTSSIHLTFDYQGKPAINLSTFYIANTTVRGQFVANYTAAYTVKSVKNVAIAKRTPFSKAVTSKTNTVFFHKNSIDKIPLLTKFEVYKLLTLDLEVAESIGLDTIPDALQYAKTVSGGQYLTAQDTVISKWKGNIYRADTTTVRAQ